jgi:hypothetical protein
MLNCSKRFFAKKKRLSNNATWIRDSAGCANKQGTVIEGLKRQATGVTVWCFGDKVDRLGTELRPENDYDRGLQEDQDTDGRRVLK